MRNREIENCYTNNMFAMTDAEGWLKFIFEVNAGKWKPAITERTFSPVSITKTIECFKQSQRKFIWEH